MKLSSLGDVLHALPALTDAARALPGVQFDWVVEEAFAEVPGWHPAVSRVIPVAIRRWRKRPLRDFTGTEWREAREQLAREDYDAVIDAQGLIKSALVARLARGPRFGLDRKSAREPVAALAYRHRLAVPRDMHAVQRIRHLFAAALDYPLPRAAGDFGIAGAFANPDREQPPLLWFFHGTARAEKTWPPDHWARLAGLAVAAGYRVALPWGSDEEQRRAGQIAADCNAAPGSVTVMPAMTLGDLATGLAGASGAVAVDTGLGHLAAALGLPSVSLYGATDPALVGTYGERQLHLVSPLADTAPAAQRMAAIQPAAVWDTLAAQLPAPA